MEKEKVRILEEGNLISVMKIMKNVGCTVDKAMAILEIPESDRQLYARSVQYALSKQEDSSSSIQPAV